MATITENLQTIKDSTADIKQAIIEKGGEVGNLTTYADAIRGIQTGTSSSFWTGHVDVEGLKAIGWDDNDISYFQEHGVNWMEEDDEYHKVPENNKALYGVINADNYKDYKDIIVYLPKFDMIKMDGYETFNNFYIMEGIPLINITFTQMYYTFGNCYNLTCIPPLDTSKAFRLTRAFSYCVSVQYIPDLDTSLATDFLGCFTNCYSLQKNPKISFKSATNLISFATNNISMQYIEILDAPLVKDNVIGSSNNALKVAKIQRMATNIRFSGEAIGKESILYIIEHEAATSPITITLHAAVYARLANDPDIVAALSNHPNVSLASA